MGNLGRPKQTERSKQLSNKITITGNLAKPLELRYTQSGKAVLGGRLADTPRRRNRDTQEWEDAGPTLWVNFSVWDREAEFLAEKADGFKGRVTVTGTLMLREYEHNGEQRQELEIRADSVALHAPREQTQRTTAPANDPWATDGGAGNDNPPF